MHEPDELLRLAAKAYPRYLKSLVKGERLFPLDIPFGKRTLAGADFETLRRLFATLRASPARFTIEWIERTDRRWGRQQFPNRIYFENAEDFLMSIGKAEEAEAFSENLRLTRMVCPELEGWLASHVLRIVDNAKQWPDILKVCRFFIDNPRPMLFPRELAIDVDTKFIERNEGILSDLLKFLIPEGQAPDARKFAAKFGLLADPPTIRFRLLDDMLRVRLKLPFSDLSVPVRELSKWSPSPLKVVITENKTTFLTLPPLPNTIGVWGGGGAAALLSECTWLERCAIVYWGDIDVSGFEILSRTRARFLQTNTVFMDDETLTRFRHLAITGKGSRIEPPLNLTHNELTALLRVMGENLILEQEKLPHEFVLKTLQTGIR